VPTLQIRLSSPIVTTVGGRASTWAEGRADGRVGGDQKDIPSWQGGPYDFRMQ